jgi:hypothetical protein
MSGGRSSHGEGREKIRSGIQQVVPFVAGGRRCHGDEVFEEVLYETDDAMAAQQEVCIPGK